MEDLLILKLYAFHDRKGSIKGEKDLIDIVGVLNKCEVDLKALKENLKEENKEFLYEDLKSILKDTKEIKFLNLNQYQMSKIRKKYKEL